MYCVASWYTAVSKLPLSLEPSGLWESSLMVRVEGSSNEQCLITCLWGIVTRQQNNPNLCYHGRRGPIFFVTKYHEDFMFRESDEHLVLINFRPVSVRDHQNEGWSAKFRQTWREIHISWLWYCNQLGVLMIHSLTHWFISRGERHIAIIIYVTLNNNNNTNKGHDN